MQTEIKSYYECVSDCFTDPHIQACMRDSALTIRPNPKRTSSRSAKRRLALTQGTLLNFERLEDRNLLAAITVNNVTDLVSPTADTSSITALVANDGGDGISLREAITATNNTLGEDTITFDGRVFVGGANSLIRLTQGELEVTETLTIDASAATDVTITGDANGDDITIPGTFITDVTASSNDSFALLEDNSRLINFTSGDLSDGGSLTLSHLSLTGGRTRGNDGSGGAVRSFFGDVLLTSSSVNGNFSSVSGGGIYSFGGDISLTNSSVSGNRANGGEGNRIGGGGISSVEGDVSLTDSDVSGNSALALFPSTADSSGGPGGGILALRGNVSLSNSTVIGNSSYLGGGGIAASNVTLTHSTVSDNSTSGSSSNARGGGIAALRGAEIIDSTVSGNSTTGSGAPGGGITLDSGNLSLINSTVSGNSAIGDSAEGGGIYTASGAVSLINSNVSGNSARFSGGGIRSFSGPISIVDSLVNDNESTRYTGGGVSSVYGAVNLYNSTVSDNQGFRGGGGIDTFRGAVTLFNSTVSGNSTTFGGGSGGGIRTVYGAVTLTNSTVSGNTVRGGDGGGGIYTSVGDVTLIDATVSGNSAVNGTGGGIRIRTGAPELSTSIVLANSIVAGNTDNGTAQDLYAGSDVILTINHSLIGVADNLEMNSGHIGNQTGTVAMPLDPLLGPLADNGGPTLTHALLLGSPAIDAGSDTLALGANDVRLTNDQRGDGFNRIKFGRVDIGAVESDFDAPAIAPSVLSVTIDEGGVLARPDLWNTLTVMFDADVTVAADDLSLVNDSTGGVAVDLSGIGFEFDSNTGRATWNFSNLNTTLEAAFYTYQLNAGSIISEGLPLDGNADGIGGDNFVGQRYLAIPGDANLDGVVDVLNDAFALIGNLNSTTNLAFADGNFNGDDRVDVLGDAFILVGNLGRDVRPPVTTASFASSQSLSASTSVTSLVATALLPIASSEADEQDSATEAADKTTLAIHSRTLVLAGDHELRDDVFSSDF